MSEVRSQFDPGSMIWRIIRHRANLLHGPAAAVLQVAHPRIALGVYEHSDFTSDPTARLHRTLDAVYTLVFEPADRQNQAAQAIQRIHERVQGDAAAHGVPGPAHYSAFEPELLMWVLATLVMSAIDGYERAVEELTAEDKARFYADMRIFGTFFGLPVEFGPQTWKEFLDYWDQSLHDPLLASHPLCRQVAQSVALPTKPWYVRFVSLPIQFIYSEILPAHLLEALGFRRTRLKRFALRIATIMLRLFVRFAPGGIKYVPHYRRAIKRLRFAQNALSRKGDSPCATRSFS